jgi:hypothetical protein
MSELNDHPQRPVGAGTLEPGTLEPGALDLEAAAPHDAPWPEDTAATGDAAVDSALERLAGVSAAPVVEHGGIYAEIHDSLLAALDADDR